MNDLSPLDLGLRAARRGHGAAARRLLDGVIAAEPDNEVATVWRARVAETPEAQAHFLRRALALNPGNRWAQETLDRLGTADAEAPAPTTGDLRATERRDRIDRLSCPKCGGSVEVHADRGTKAVVCTYCGSVLDLTSRQVGVIGQTRPKVRIRVPIQPGDVATFYDERHLVLGWLRYKGWDDEDTWEWDEWQLVGDNGTVRYLSYSSDEGFLLQTPLHPTPRVDAKGIDMPGGRLGGGRVRFSETSPAQIKAVRGELTWRPKLKETLKVGEAKRGNQHVSVELTADEIEVVAGPSLADVEVWTAFDRPDMIEKVQEAEAKSKAARKRSRPALLASLLFLLGAFVSMGVGTTVLDAAVTVQRSAAGVSPGPEAAAPPVYDLGTFDVTDVEDTFEVDVRARLTNTWTAPDVYLVEPSGGRVYLFTADLWDEPDESDRSDSHLFKPRETGEHRLEVELLESQTSSADLTVEVRRGVWMARYFLFAAFGAFFLGFLVNAAGGTGRFTYR
ncbi:MAG: hypothetical protein AAF845_19540 [Bacteroidota bacterium]